MARYIDADAVVSKLDNLVEEYVKHDCIQCSLAAGVLADFRDTELNEIPFADVVEVVRCKDCKYAIELDKHCDINRNAYRHCGLCRGEETKNVWHKYKKYYKDYSIVEAESYCDSGERKEDEGK